MNASDVSLDTTGTTATTSNFSCTQTTNVEVNCTISIDNGTTNQDIKINVTDAAGNISTATETGYSVDTIAPVAPAINSPANNTDSNDSTPTISGTGEPNSTITIFVGGVPVGTTTTDASGN